MHHTPSTAPVVPNGGRRRAVAGLLVAALLAAMLGGSVGELWGAAPSNLLTLDQQTLEHGVQGWVGGGTSTLSTTSAPTAQGAKALAVTAGKAPSPDLPGNANWFLRFVLSNSGAETLPGAAGIPVTPGWHYDGRAQVHAETNARVARCGLNWYDQAGKWMSVSAGSIQRARTGSWTKLTCGAEAPAGAVTASVRVYFFGVRTGEVHYVDDAWLTTADGAAPSSTYATRISSAGAAAYTAPSGVTFVADQAFRGGEATGVMGTAIAATSADPLYVKHRWGMSSYIIPVPSAATYRVRLHFAETVFTAAGKRVFDVSAEGTPRIDDLDVFATAGADRAHIEQFDVEVTDGRLVLGFGAQIEDPMISAVEVLQSTTGSTTTTTTGSTTTTTGSTTTTSTTVAPTTTTTTTTTTTPPPDPGGFPSAANTGPSGPLTPSGTIVTSRDGEVIQNVDVTGSIQVRHNNVTIRNVRVRQPGGTAIAIDPATSGALVEDCELDGTGDTRAMEAIAFARYTIRRCDIHHFGEGPRANGETVVEDNYIHDFVDYFSIGAHQDGVQVVCGDNIVIRGNTILIDTETANAAIMIGTACGTVDNVVITGNLMAGGGYVVFGGSDAAFAGPNATNVTITDNRISTMFFPNGGFYGPFTNTDGIVMSGNVWHETGAGI